MFMTHGINRINQAISEEENEAASPEMTGRTPVLMDLQ
jgi:hypothetical protein